MPWFRRSLGVAPPALLQSRLNSKGILSDINTSSAVKKPAKPNNPTEKGTLMSDMVLFFFPGVHPE